MIKPYRSRPLPTIIWPLLILALLFVCDLFFIPGFFKLEIKDGIFSGFLIDILKNSSKLMLLAIGLTLVIATKGIDVSVGSVVAITGAIFAVLVSGGGQIIDGSISKYPMLLAILAALGAAILCGVWNGFLVSKLGIQPIIATLILMVSGRGIAQLVTDGQIITVYYTPFSFIGNGTLFGLPFPLFIAGFVLAFALLITRKTALGLFIESIGINPTASRFTGIKSKQIVFLTYVFCGLCAGIAGLIVSSNVKSADGNNAGLLMELDGILAVVLGGTSMNGGKFSLWGSIVGALIVQTLSTTIYATGVPAEATQVVKALVVFIVALIQSPDFRKTLTGLVPRKATGGVR